jgi:hypothetical protein
MSLSASGQPLHSRTLSVTLTQAEPPRVAFAAYVLDLRKRGIAPVGGDLQGPGVIHHMLLDGVIDRASGRLDTIGARMPAVAFEASPATGGESCRDLIGRVDSLGGAPLDGGYARALGSEIGGPRGCSHILTLAHLLGPTAGWAFAADAHLHGSAPARRLGERIFRRDITVDGYETRPVSWRGAAARDLPLRPAPALARAMDRFAAQTEVVARADLDEGSAAGELQIAAAPHPPPSSARPWCERSDAAAALVGQSLRSGISAAILGHFAAAPDDAPLRDARCSFADVSSVSPPSTSGRWHRPVAPPSRPWRLPDSCWMWRRGGGWDYGAGTEAAARGVVDYD